MNKSTKLFTKLLSFGFVALFSGCAVGNKYDYQLKRLPLPLAGESALGLTVVDQRPYVLSGKKSPTYAGLQRGYLEIPLT